MLAPSSPGAIKVYSIAELVDPSHYMPLNYGVDQFFLVDENDKYDDVAFDGC